MTNYACEDHDFIAKRLAEIRKEKEEALKRNNDKPAEQPVVSNTVTDDSWYCY